MALASDDPPAVAAAATATPTVRDAASAAAGVAYGRLLAWLAWQWRDIAAAEDALSEALLAALTHWPREGIPASPEGWLMTAAKRNLMKAARHRRMAGDPAVTTLLPSLDEAAPDVRALPDDRLRLMFVCAHPAIAPPLRTALMLQTVLGLDAARIARACLVTPEAMSKRLVRAKAKIKANGIRFEEPETRELPTRVDAVLEAIYGAYTLDWDEDGGSDGSEASGASHEGAGGLAAEALYLAGLVASLLPGHAEAWGLLALLELVESRRHARSDAAGLWVPLHEQDCKAWDHRLIDRAGTHLAHAASLHCLGPFQLEAAIQLAHASRRQGGPTPWADIEQLYEGLLSLHPSVGATIGHALAVAYARGDAALGLQRLATVDEQQRERHLPWWAAQAHLLQRAGRRERALLAYEKALSLARSDGLRRTLAARQLEQMALLH